MPLSVSPGADCANARGGPSANTKALSPHNPDTSVQPHHGNSSQGGALAEDSPPGAATKSRREALRTRPDAGARHRALAFRRAGAYPALATPPRPVQHGARRVAQRTARGLRAIDFEPTEEQRLIRSSRA